MFDKISELKHIREQKSKLSERESELTRPFLTDLSLIATLFVWFNEIQADRVCSPRVDSVIQRKKFIFIVLYLFSPSTLAGGKIANGLRIVLAEILGFKSPTAISNLCTDAVFLYSNYKDYRNDIDSLYGEIFKRLKIKGIIK